jgi:hypothetical protein
MIMQLFRRQSSGEFRTRSPERDKQADFALLGSVGKAIDDALATLQAESEGLNRRLTDSRERASLAAGNEYDEYLTREPSNLAGLRKFEEEMRQATARLKVLDEEIGHLRFVRATFYSRFTELAPADSKR